MSARDKDRKTKKRVYIINIVIIFICIFWWLGGYIFTLMINNKMNNISQLLQGGTMLLYTLYIPIAIAILQYFLSKKYIPSINIKTLLKRVFNIKTHILLILASILAVILIDTENRFFIFFGIFIWILSSIKIIFDLKETNSFITSSAKSKYWFDFLSKTDEKDFVEGIVDIFSMSPNGVEEQIEKESKDKIEIGDNDIRNYTQWNDAEREDFINLILGKIEVYKDEYNYNTVYSIFNIVYKNTSKINFNYRNKLFITKLFEYRYSFWYQYQDSAENKENLIKSIYRLVEEILIKILQKSLQDPHPVSATIDFFEALDRHIQEHNDKVIQFKGKDEKYLEFFKYFGQRVITEILNMPDEYSARDVLEYQWSKSDRNWQINLSNLQSENYSQITNYWFKIMWEYISNIWRKDFNRPKKIEYKDIKKVNILINAFIPDINPEPFMQITELWFWSKEANAVKMYIENRVFTGIMSNVEVLSFDYNTTEEEENSVWEKRNKEQIQKTIDIIVKIYERYGLNKVFCENIENQIKKINRNELDDNKLYRLDSLQTTIGLIVSKIKSPSQNML